MKIFCVNIYIETSLRGPAVKKGAGEWIVEFVRGDGVPVTRSGMLRKEKTNQNALALELLKDALSILTKSCSVRVNTQCKHILNTMQNNWLSSWKKNGWQNAKGKTVQNLELWQKCSELMENHCTEFDSGSHSYQIVMQRDIRKEMENESSSKISR